VLISARALGADSVEIVLSDNGSGMTPEIRRQAFDPFFTTRRGQGSTGLGLHIVHNIVTDRLGGQIDLESEPGRSGTTFRIVLPREAPMIVE
jgi:signal transduction histidine kinase